MAGTGVVWARRGGVVLTVLLVLATAAVVLLALRGDEERRSREFTATRLTLRTVGDVEVRAGSGDRIVLTRHAHGSPEVAERVDGGVLNVEARCAWPRLGCRADYRIAVPDGVRLELHTDSGDVVATGLTSRLVTASSGSGDVELGFAVAPATVDASTGSGDVDVRVPAGSTYRVDATAPDDRHVDVPTEATAERLIKVRSESGDVTVR